MEARPQNFYKPEDLPLEGRTELGLAAASGNLDECRRLIESGENPLDPDSYLETPLHLACCFGHLSVVKMLVRECRVDLDPVNWEGWTPICFSVARGHIAVMKYLLKCRSDGQWISSCGWQLMHIASWYNQAEIVEWLAKHGATTLTETAHSCRAFDMTRPGHARRILYECMQEELNEDM
ncbi:hypothetical protein CEUSTIGMA_g5506.t1 [Chlamydomonas eustigma]|uniref:Uncharacterized protein n=1 Tax=Chlamydomonas eustigma TaxID=1157962 RepID=A0A250X4Q6_9CHLO|nr:hypothetical protein CEUSTIGMA_g5506.t1 [Chlamydomonas eustigma]|eukprot:GAX78064.1 hypothetical protein CEUSTIGMA_g5506.t1 [Chlamydomonas eustigma]